MRGEGERAEKQEGKEVAEVSALLLLVRLLTLKEEAFLVLCVLYFGAVEVEYEEREDRSWQGALEEGVHGADNEGGVNDIFKAGRVLG